MQYSAVDYHKIKLPNLSFKQRKNAELEINNRNMYNLGSNLFENHSGELSEGSTERLPSAKGCVKISRNSKVNQSRSMLTKNEDSVGQEEEDFNKKPTAKRKIKIIHNANKSNKETVIKNSHMVILKSIKQKLNLQGMLKNKD